MMPCRLCSPDGVPKAGQRGLKQKGKTTREGSHGTRLYVCQDCGALWKMEFDTATREFSDTPVFRLVKGGAA